MSDTNTSATGGILLPENSVLEDVLLVALLQTVFSELSGLPGSLVRPRWQPNPPAEPSVSTNWLGVGITNRHPIDYPEEIMQPNGDGAGNGNVIQVRQEELEILASFYGPNCYSISSQTRDAMYIRQNLQAWEAAGMTLIECQDTVSVPELINTQWVQRCDLPVRLRRALVRTYAIRYFLNFSTITIITDYGFQVVVYPPNSSNRFLTDGYGNVIVDGSGNPIELPSIPAT